MVKIFGSTPVDKKAIKNARDLNKEDAKRPAVKRTAKRAPAKKITRTTRNEETAEAKTTIAEKKNAAERQFDRADMAAKETLAETQARMAARGF